MQVAQGHVAAPYCPMECQYHGDLILARDVSALMISPADAAGQTSLGTPVSELAKRFAAKHGCALVWMNGSVSG